MEDAVVVPLTEYLHTAYHPDCDYLEGQVMNRTLGERPHAKLQQFLIVTFSLAQDAWQVIPLPEQRVQVRENRFRIPDVCVVRDTDPDTDIVTTAPLLCIEILSSNDTLASTQERVDDYAAMGVQHIWVIDPWKRQAFYGGAAGYTEAFETLAVPETPIRIALGEVFARLDRK